VVGRRRRGEIVRRRRLSGACGRPLNFTVRRRVSARSLARLDASASCDAQKCPVVTRNVMGYTGGNDPDPVVPSQGIG
jgi:hypothetical protein